jgi:hypothetical protein
LPGGLLGKAADSTRRFVCLLIGHRSEKVIDGVDPHAFTVLGERDVRLGYRLRSSHLHCRRCKRDTPVVMEIRSGR